MAGGGASAAREGRSGKAGGGGIEDRHRRTTLSNKKGGTTTALATMRERGDDQNDQNDDEDDDDDDDDAREGLLANENEREKNLALVLDAISSNNDNQGVSDEDLARFLPPSLTLNVRLEIINELLNNEQITLHTEEGEKAICYFTRVSDEEILKKRGLTSEDRLVLQIIETAGNNGMWTKEVKQKSNLPQVKITKIFKTLETRKLIKSVKHVAHQNRKVYMKYDLEPSREITGGAWFTDQEFDSDFVDEMRNVCLVYIRDEKKVTLQDVFEYIVESKVSKVNLRKEDVKQIVDTLIYDGDVDMITPEERLRKNMDAYEDDFIDDRKNKRGSRGEGMLMYESDEEEEYEDSEEDEYDIATTKKRKKGSTTKNNNKKKKQKKTENGKSSNNNNKKKQHKKKGGTGRGVNESEETTIEIIDDDDDLTETYYVPSKWKSDADTTLSYVPCGICTLFEECKPGGLISPEKCVYMTDWIKDIEETGNVEAETMGEDEEEEEEE